MLLVIIKRWINPRYALATQRLDVLLDRARWQKINSIPAGQSCFLPWPRYGHCTRFPRKNGKHIYSTGLENSQTFRRLRNIMFKWDITKRISTACIPSCSNEASWKFWELYHSTIPSWTNCATISTRSSNNSQMVLNLKSAGGTLMSKNRRVAASTFSSAPYSLHCYWVLLLSVTCVTCCSSYLK